MQSKAATVAEYLAELPPDRRAAMTAVREVILANIDPGFREGMSYGSIGYCVPHTRYPPGYHCNPKQPLPYAGLASQKNYMSLYVPGGCFGDECEGQASESNWFRKAWAATGKKLDMGKGCLRFRKLDDLALDVVAEAFRRLPLDTFIAQYEALRAAYAPKPRAEIKAMMEARKAAAAAKK
jgi:hypothetical protein